MQNKYEGFNFVAINVLQEKCELQFCPGTSPPEVEDETNPDFVEWSWGIHIKYYTLSPASMEDARL
jgi:hypothetical protein